MTMNKETRRLPWNRSSQDAEKKKHTHIRLHTTPAAATALRPKATG